MLYLLLIVLSIIALIGGFIFLSEATTGVGIIGVAGVLAIFARLAQAETHHDEQMSQIEQLEESNQESWEAYFELNKPRDDQAQSN